MAKEDKKNTKKTDEAPKRKFGERATYKFNIDSIAEKRGVNTFSARTALRNAKVAKTSDGVYGWNTEKEFLEAYNTAYPKTDKADKAGKKAKAA